MRKILLFLVSLFFVNTFAPAQAGEKVVILSTRKKTSVSTSDKGELIVNVSQNDAEKIRSNGFVNYKIFGAKADGKTDDIEAIAAAHAYANQEKLPVKAEDNATYYIGGKYRLVEIFTDTDFGTANFTIDDTHAQNPGRPIFSVKSEMKPVKLKGVASLIKNQPKIDAALSGPHLIQVVNEKVKQYIRFGGNQNSGSSQTDVFIVDKNGNVDMNAPIIWDFDNISSITAVPLDETSLTLKGGKFRTIANAEGEKTSYYSRGIEIRRSNVVIDGLEHTITGEGEVGSPYRGFIVLEQCANVTVQNTNLTGHKMYRKIGNAGTSVPMGSYDLHANQSLNISFINCKQLNDIHDSKYWGIFASNFCKNILFDNCSFSRFDAHQGVTNATILNSELGYQGMSIIGFGKLLVENTTVTSNSFINLRQDYGSTWQGEFIVRNCIFQPRGSNLSDVNLINGFNSGQHNFGYTCYMPEGITIENLQIIDSKVSDKYKGPAIFTDFNPEMKDESYVEKFPFIKTKKVILKNITTVSGKQIRTSDNAFMFKDVDVTIE